MLRHRNAEKTPCLYDLIDTCTKFGKKHVYNSLTPIWILFGLFVQEQKNTTVVTTISWLMPKRSIIYSEGTSTSDGFPARWMLRWPTESQPLWCVVMHFWNYASKPKWQRACIFVPLCCYHHLNTILLEICNDVHSVLPNYFW